MTQLNIHPGSTLDAEVLIVEDTPASLALLTELMRGAGCAVRQAQDGEMALLSVQGKAPDLILLDIRMPGMDGFEVCRQLKANPATADIPILFLSALTEQADRVQGLALGAVDYIGKPYNPDEVLLRVRTHLELRTLQLHLGEMCELRTAQLTQEIAVRRRAEAELYESRQQLRELAGYQEEVREAERRRIAREIHDELGQALTVARIDLSRMSARLPEPCEQFQKTISNIITTLDQAADTARTISDDLRPGMLDLLGLPAAIEHHVMRFGEATGIRCALHLAEDELQLDDKVATAAFRIVQESLTNIARHAHARQVDIRLTRNDSELLVSVQDDGQGMAVAQPQSRQGHYGLLGMSERAQALGGKLAIDSTPGKGTRIEARLPCQLHGTAT